MVVRLRTWARTHRHGLAAIIVSVVPIWVAAMRAGLAGLSPAGDAAVTVLRARAVLTTDPPLVGMVAAGASSSDQLVHFPGAWQL